MGILGNWLPEDPQQNAAARQGLLALGGAMMSAKGSNFLGTLGQGLLAGGEGYQGALQQQQQQQLMATQQKRWDLENQQTQAGLDRQKMVSGVFSELSAPAAQGAPAPVTAGPAGVQGFGRSPIAGLPQKGQPTAQNMKQRAYDEALRYAAGLMDRGLTAEAQPYLKIMEQLSPKLKEQRALTVDGKRVVANVFEDGTTQQLDGFAPDLEKLHFANTGGATVGQDQFTGRVVSTIQNTQSPDSRARIAQDERESRRVDERIRAAAVPSADGLLPDETVAMMAEQYRAGDTSVMQNLGRGAQGAQNIIRLRNEIARQTREAGQGGRDLAAQNAEYFGTKAGQRSAGTRIANVEMAVYEAQNLVPLALEASQNVARSGLLPFGKGQIMFNEQTNSPAMREFAAANNALVNTYARAISPTGQPTISDKEHARELLSTAYDQKSYEATVRQMQREMEAAQKAPQQVRKAFSDAVTGRGGHSPVKDVKDLPKKPTPSGHPADISNLLNKYGAK